MSQPLVVVENGQLAIDYLAGQGPFSDRQKNPLPCLALLDLKLPGGDSCQVCRVARQTEPATQVVVITGHRAEMDGQVRQMLSDGALAVLHKPFDMPALLATVRQLALGQQEVGQV